MASVTSWDHNAAEARRLPPAMLRWFERCLGTDLSAVRVHCGPDADDMARALGARAFTCGTNMVFADGAYRPDSDEGLRLLAHEAVHVLQQALRPRREGPWSVSHPDDPSEREAERFAALVAHGRAVPGRRTGMTVQPFGTRTIQRHVSFEHRLLGDAPTPNLVAISTKGPTRSQVLQNQIALLALWRTNPLAVTPADITRISPWIRTLRLGPDQVLLTYGEINALPDYLSNPMALDSLPASLLLPILQCIRQEGYNQLTYLLTNTNPNVKFARAAADPWKLSMVNTLIETQALDALTYGLGLNGADHYQGLLARNACHFAPYSWFRWQASHLVARDLATRAYAATDPALKAALTQQAWTKDGYADHFLEDSFAAGHLVNKTLIMQWFVEWAAKETLLPIPDWDLIKNMTPALQPNLAGFNLYNPQYQGPSNDPQAVEEYFSVTDRLVSLGLAFDGADRWTVYQQFLTFLTSAVTQIASANLHDYYNSNSAWVSAPAIPTPFEVWGDDTLLSGANGGTGVQYTSATAQMSQQAINDILTKGATNISPQQIRNQFPSKAGPNSQSLTDLATWNSAQKDFCLSNFEQFLPILKTILLGLASPRLGTVSRDHDFSQTWYTSLPNSGFSTVHTVASAQAMFVGSNGYAYQLDPAGGHVLNSLLVTGNVGVGDYTTRVATNGRYVFVGVHGYVYGISLADWTRSAWSMGVGGTGYKPVDVIVSGGRLFAGSNGYVYELNPTTGAIVNSRLVTSGIGVGDYTTKIATDGQNLYIGVHGYAYGLSLASWQTSWSVNLEGAGYNPVTVLSQGGQVFAGCNGYVYQITPQGQRTNSLLVTGSIGVGDYTTQLAADSRNLYAGVHGYVYALPLNTKWSGTTWNVGVGGTSYNRVSVLTQNGRLFAGSNGYAYDISPASGTILHSLLLASMTGIGNYDTTLAGDGHSLYAGAHGYSYKLTTLYTAGVGPLGLIDAAADPDGSVQVVALDAKGSLWHTVRAANGTWPYAWGDVLNTVPGRRIGPVRWASTAADGKGNLQVLALDAQNTLWHTIRLADGTWPSAWGNVQAVMQGNGFPGIGPTPFVAGATDPGGNLHVLALDAQKTLWYTIRLANGTWPSAWGNVQAVMQGNGFPGIGPTPFVAAATDPGGNLHVLALTEDSRPWHTVRAASGNWPAAWENISALVQPPLGPLRTISGSANSDGSLQIAVVAADGTLWHTIRAANGTWPNRWGNVQAVMAGAGSPEIGPTPAVAVSTDPAGNLHVVVLDEQDQAWHTYRAPSGPWPQAWYGIKAAT